jgi:hypothetical protein
MMNGLKWRTYKFLRLRQNKYLQYVRQQHELGRRAADYDYWLWCNINGTIDELVLPPKRVREFNSQEIDIEHPMMDADLDYLTEDK